MTSIRAEMGPEMEASVSQASITQSQIGVIAEVTSSISDVNVLVTSLEKVSLNYSDISSSITDAQVIYDSE